MNKETVYKTLLDKLEANLESFTNVEGTIARFFLKNQDETDLSGKRVSSLLYVSEASLSRFAQKCGFKGYREFLFTYETERSSKNMLIDKQAKQILSIYQELLDQTYSLVSGTQMHQVAELLSQASRVYLYGMGSSGIAALEFKLRFMRLGLDVEAVTDTHIMKINSAIVKQDSLIIGISISGKTNDVLTSLALAKARGATTLLITSNDSPDLRQYCHNILHVAGAINLDGGNLISPQFPVLVFMDIFYTYYLDTDFYHKLALHNSTLSALDIDHREYE